VKTASGAIKTSLWNTFRRVKRSLELILALHLADVYSWTIDFYGLQKGDNFRIIYEQIYVDSLPTGNSQALMQALFNFIR